MIVGSGPNREPLEALVHAIDTGDRPLYDWLVANGWSFSRDEESGPWEELAALSKAGAAELDPIDAAAVFHASPAIGHGGVNRFAERVHFFGRLPHALLKFVFPCCDVAVFPSCIPEAYPLVLMESLANGVMPMCSDFSGFSDGLDELEGLLSEDKKPVAKAMRITTDAARKVRARAFLVPRLRRQCGTRRGTRVPPSRLRRVPPSSPPSAATAVAIEHSCCFVSIAHPVVHAPRSCLLFLTTLARSLFFFLFAFSFSWNVVRTSFAFLFLFLFLVLFSRSNVRSSPSATI